MRPAELKLWQVFINTAGYLTIVYRKAKNAVMVVNYNGNFYSIKIDSSCDKYVPSDITPEQFFDEFPINDCFTYHLVDYKEKFNSIRNKYFKTQTPKFNRKLLIIKKRRKS